MQYCAIAINMSFLADSSSYSIIAVVRNTIFQIHPYFLVIDDVIL